MSPATTMTAKALFDDEPRRMALTRALVGLDVTEIQAIARRAEAYFRAGCASPISAAEDADALGRELTRRRLFSARLGPSAAHLGAAA